MATVGTVASAPDQYRNYIATISGIAGTGTTPIVRSQGFVIGSWQSFGLAATGLTAELYGSNDGVNFYAMPGASAEAADGVFPLIAQTSGGTNIVPVWFMWTIGGTYVSGTLSIIATMMSTFG